MKARSFLPGNQQGFALISALLIMVILTIIGIATMNTAEFDLDIVRNERIYNRWFLTADSGWKQAASFLDAKSEIPQEVNKTANPLYPAGTDYRSIMRNFGAGGDGTLNLNFTDANDDGALNGTGYRYKVVRIPSDAETLPGYSEGQAVTQAFKVISHAGSLDVEAIMWKTWNTGGS